LNGNYKQSTSKITEEEMATKKTHNKKNEITKKYRERNTMM